MRHRWPLLILVLAPLIALWPGLTGLAVGPFDQIRQMAPWNGPKPIQPWDVLMADSVLQSHVWRTLVLDAWGKGQLPLLNPYEFGGTPLLANSQSGGFYPPHIILGLLHVPAGFAGFLLAWFHLALAGLGLNALVRRLGGSAPAGLTGGLLFSLSPFMLGWTALSSVISTLAWLPLALACVTDVTNRKSWLALTACISMMLLAGHLQFSAYGIGAIVLMALPLSSPQRKAGASDGRGPSLLLLKAGAVFAALAFGFALAAPQVLPVLAWSKESHRRNSPTEKGYQDYIGSAIKPYELANLGHPMALGSPREPIQVGGQTIATYWPPLVKPGANFAESAISLGAVAFALLFAVPWRRRETWSLAALGGLAFLLAIGTPLNRLLYFFVPGWSSTGSPGRIESIFVLCACVLAGLAVDRLSEKKAQIAAGAGLVVALLLAFVLPGLAEATEAAAALRGAATASVLPSLLIALCLAGGAVFLSKKSLWAIPAGAVLVAAWTHALILVPFGVPLEPPKGDPDARIAVVNDQWDILTARPALLPPNLASLGGLHEISGYDSLTSRTEVEMLRTASGSNDPAPPANGNMMFVKPTFDLDALAEDGVTEVWSTKSMPQLGAGESRNGYIVQKLEGPGIASYGGGNVKLQQQSYDHMTAQIVGKPGGNLTVRVLAQPGWTATAEGGKEIPLSPGYWLEANNVSASSVEFVYRPPALRTGVMLFAFALVVLIGLLILASRRKPVKEVES